MQVIPTGSDWTPLDELNNFLGATLSDAWECYYRPHLNGRRPDIVLLNPQHGAIAARLVRLPASSNSALREYAKSSRPGRISDFVIRDCFDRLVGDHTAMTSLLGLSGPKASVSPVRTILVAESAEKDTVANLMLAWGRETRLATEISQGVAFRAEAGTHAICTSEDLATPDGLKTVLQLLKGTYFSEDDARRLRQFMTEPYLKAVQREPLELNPAQRRLSRERTPAGRRRIQGPAGSGKSLVLAARAAQLASEGKSVLVVSFNKTLWHYLYNLFLRHLKTLTGDNRQQFNEADGLATFTHFHGYLKSLCTSSGHLEAAYLRLFRDKPKGGPPTDEIVALARHALKAMGPQFDAIMVDEGQDWNGTWVPVLTESLKPGGELLVAEDVTQDIYGRVKSHRDGQARFGIRANKSELRVSYRLHPALIPVLDSYGKAFLGDERDIPAPFEGFEFELGELTFALYQAKNEEAMVERTVAAALHAYTHFRATLAFPDIFLICPNRKLGEAVCYALRGQGLEVLETFTGDKEDFWEAEPPIKASTPHSLKGWESRAVVAAFPSVEHTAAKKGLYIAMTRVLRHLDGSLLSIVTADEELATFARAHRFTTQTPPPVDITPPRPKSSGGRSSVESPTASSIPIGSIVTIDVGGDREVYEFVRDRKDARLDEYDPCSISSPLGRLISTLEVGASGQYTLPSGASLKVTLLEVQPPVS